MLAAMGMACSHSRGTGDQLGTARLVRPMLDRALDKFVAVVTRERKWVIAIVLGVVAASASQLPRLQMDSAPEELMVSRAGYAAASREFRDQFGDTDSIALLLI